MIYYINQMRKYDNGDLIILNLIHKNANILSTLENIIILFWLYCFLSLVEFTADYEKQTVFVKQVGKQVINSI